MTAPNEWQLALRNLESGGRITAPAPRCGVCGAIITNTSPTKPRKFCSYACKGIARRKDDSAKKGVKKTKVLWTSPNIGIASSNTV